MSPIVLGAGLTFVAVIVLIVGAYWMFVAQPEDREKVAVRQRLKTEKRSKILAIGLLNEVRQLSQVGLVDQLLRRTGSIVKPVEGLIAQAGMTINVSIILLTCGCLGLAAFVVGQVTIGRWWASLPLGLFATFLPIFFLRFKRDRRIIRLEEQFPDTIDLIARALRAGHAFTTGLSIITEEIEEPLGGEFRRLYERQNFGMPLPDALREFAERIPILDAKFFATAVLTQRESGGNLAEILDNLSSVIRERFKVKRQVRVISAHGRMTGWILAALPPALAVAFMVVSPGHIDMLLNDVLGIQMIVLALGLQVIGTVIINKIVKIEY